MSKEAFNKLFIEQLQDLFNAESQLIAALPALTNAASSQELREALAEHLDETKHHLKRLQQIFSGLNIHTDGYNSAAMHGLISESQEILKAGHTDAVKDAALIAAVQCIAHYLIARYGTAKTFAKELDLQQAADLLKVTLEEKRRADEHLNDLAEGGFFKAGINRRARK